MSARTLAAELEVSERTIYRDVEALSTAGVPIYAETGVKGGYALLDSYRTTLTGMTDAEVRALFMLNIPEPLVDLGVSQELRSAFRKLTAALPAQRRQDEIRVRQRVYLDAHWWFHGGESITHLPVMQQAVWQGCKVFIDYALPYGLQTGVKQTIEPYGLVAKAGVWYVVYAINGRFQAKRISKIRKAVLTEESFVRQEEFDLAAFWQTWCQAFEAQRTQYLVRMRVAPHFVGYLPYHFGEAVLDNISAENAGEEMGWLALTVSFESLEDARAKLLGLGAAVEVLSPLPLRLSLADFAAQIVKLYE